MASNRTLRFGGTDEREIEVTDAFGEGIFFSTEVLLSLSPDDLTMVQIWLKEQGEGMFGTLEFVEARAYGVGNSKYEFFETVKNSISSRRLLAVEKSSYASDFQKEIAAAVLNGDNPYPKPEKPPKQKRPPQEGYVYLMWADNGLHKIGRSKSVNKRMEEFCIKLPLKTRLVHTIKSQDYEKAEIALHERYSDKRERGEWFRLTEQDVADICAIKDGEL